MSNLNFFDIVTNLPFDPLEKKPKTIKAEIEKKLKDLRSEYTRATQPEKQKTIKEQIDCIEAVDLDNTLLQEHSERKIKKEMSILISAVQIQVKSGTNTVTEGLVKHHRKERGLSEERVRKVFEDAGIVIEQVDVRKALPVFPVNADKARESLSGLRGYPKDSNTGADPSVAVDLYSLAVFLSAYLDKKPGEDGIMFRMAKTSELSALFDRWAKTLSKRQKDMEKICAFLATTAKMNVFDKEEHRKQYDSYLVYCSDELTKLFSSIKILPEEDRRKPRYADTCIKTIQEFFPDSDTAIAIYNKEAGIIDNPYIPTAASYIVKCKYCSHISSFETEKEAQSNNRCSNCGRELFRKCDNCGKYVQVTKESCPHCNYVFASAALFEQFYRQADIALRAGDFDSARALLFKAESVAPGEKKRIDDFQKRLEADEQAYKKPINLLKQLFAEDKYQTAKQKLASIIKEYPKLNVSEFEKKIDEAVQKAVETYEPAKGKGGVVQANAAVEALTFCSDYAPALEYLKKTPPNACNGLKGVVNTQRLSISLNWNTTLEKDVQYRIVRREGKEAAKSEFEGVTIADQHDDLFIEDKNIVSGQYYTYTVFAKRKGLCAPPASVTLVLLTPVSAVSYEQRDKSMFLSWKQADNCSGVIVSRTVNGNQEILSSDARNGFEDNRLNYNAEHTYSLTALYREGGKSEPVSFSVVPTFMVQSFSIALKSNQLDQYTISWSIRQKGVDMKLLVDGQEVKRIRSDLENSTITLPENGLYKIQAKALSGSKWIDSENELQINTFKPCSFTVDVEETQKAGTGGNSRKVEFTLKTPDSIPDDVTAFLFFVRKKADDAPSAPWVTEEEAETRLDGNRVSVNTYLTNDKMVKVIIPGDEENYYISTFTVYSVDGKDVLSSPARKKVGRPLTADLFWKVTKSMIGGRKLSIQINANRKFSRIPRLVLCTSSTGRNVLSPQDNDVVELLNLPAKDLDKSQINWEEEVSISSNIPKKQSLYLFVLDYPKNESFAQRWAAGFNGKI